MGLTLESKHEYRNYEDYLNHQKEKTTDRVKRQKRLNEEWDLRLDGFKAIFSQHHNCLNDVEEALCLGARTGQEVEALLQIGIKAIGIDLVGHQPHVLEGDVHCLNCEDQSLDFVLSNIFDHSLYPQNFCREIERLLRPKGHALVQLQIDLHQDQYTEQVVHSSADVVKLFQQCEVVFD